MDFQKKKYAGRRYIHQIWKQMNMSLQGQGLSGLNDEERKKEKEERKKKKELHEWIDHNSYNVFKIHEFSFSS